MTKSYRVTMFDRNNIRPNVEFIIDAETKSMAIAVAREALVSVPKHMMNDRYAGGHPVYDLTPYDPACPVGRDNRPSLDIG